MSESGPSDAAIYARVSTSDQDVSRQLDEARAHPLLGVRVPEPEPVSERLGRVGGHTRGSFRSRHNTDWKRTPNSFATALAARDRRNT
ncbi:hypothetical protein EXE41_16745 [Halorubrum sp. SD690R]|nr:hypothetical protein EXE41_16745 [Halorubrum sp. SD690R]